MWLFYFALLLKVTFLHGVDPGHDPEINMTTIQMAQFWGYPEANAVEVTTEDGYILEMHHIPYGRNGAGMNLTNRPVVFIQHGLDAASDCFTWNLPNQSIAFVFADYGFDVWLGNMRGNIYSQNHVSLNISDQKYWKFSWDEMAKYDLDAMISKVLNLTGAPSLYYVGHSQGTMIMFAKLSSDPNFAQKIKAYFALAPIGTVKNINGLLAFLANELYFDSEILLDLLGPSEFTPKSPITELAAEYFCSETSNQNFKASKKPKSKDDGEEFCDNLLFLICGPNTFQMNVTRTAVYTNHVGGTSTQNVMHWLQNVKSGLQQAYDYGSPANNTAVYGTSLPPIYNISLVNAPTYLYWSDNDWLGDPIDIENYILKYMNPAYLKGNYHFTDYNHLDFIVGMNAAEEIYRPMAKIIQNDFF